MVQPSATTILILHQKMCILNACDVSFCSIGTHEMTQQPWTDRIKFGLEIATLLTALAALASAILTNRQVQLFCISDGHFERSRV